MPKDSTLSTVFGSIVGMSRNIVVDTELSAKNPFEFMMRMAAGGNSRRHIIRASKEAGDVLIAPKPLGDIVVIHMAKGYPLHVRLGNLLAYGEGVSVNTQPSLSGTGRWITKVSGSGDIAITSFGSLFRLSLSEEDKYWVNSKNLVAWHDTISELTDEQNGSILDSLKFWGSGKRPAGLVCVRGPGDLFLQSRVRAEALPQRKTHDEMDEEEDRKMLKDETKKEAEKHDYSQPPQRESKGSFLSKIFK